jgi:hypothetical protein
MRRIRNFSCVGLIVVAMLVASPQTIGADSCWDWDYWWYTNWCEPSGQDACAYLQGQCPWDCYLQLSGYGRGTLQQCSQHQELDGQGMPIWCVDYALCRCEYCVN